MKLKNDNFDGIYHLKNEAYIEPEIKEEKIEEKAEKPKKRARKKGEK